MKSRVAATTAIFTLALALYLPTLSYGFTGWDDTSYVVDNPSVTSPLGLATIWTSRDGDVYYPLTFSCYWLEYRLWGASPAGYHATNALLHAIDAVLLFFFLEALGAGTSAAALGAAIFAAHPVQVMSVAWIAERKNLLALLFALLALLAWMREGRAFRVLSLLAFVAALLSKTAVLGLAVAFLGYDLLVRRDPWRRALPWSAAMLAPSIAAGIVTIAFERPFVDLGASGLIPAFWERAQIAGAAPWFYLAKLVVPWPLSPAYPRWGVGAARIMWWLPLAATLAGTIALARFVRPPRIRWLLLLGAVLLAPSLGLAAFANLAVSFVSDHFLYLASPAIFGVLALSIGRLARPAVVACVPLAAVTLSYSPVFRDASSLWSRVVAVDPQSYAGNLGLAEARAAAGRFDDARPLYERAIALRPKAIDAYLVLGRREYERGDAAAAVERFEKALTLYPDSVPAMVGLAEAKAASGDPSHALELATRAVAAAPRDVAARMELGTILLGYARPGDALAQFLAVLPVAPADGRAHLGAATCLRALGRYREAVDVLDDGLKRRPDDVALVNFLALMLAASPDDAVRDGARAVALARRACAAGGPASYELHATLAAAYAESGRFDDAVGESRIAEEGASSAGDSRSAAEQRRRGEAYAARRPLRF